MEKAIASAKDRQSYLARDSIYLIYEEVIVVFLGNYSEGVSKTWIYSK